MATIRRIKPHEGEVLRTARLLALADAPYAFADTVEQARQMPDSRWQQRAQAGSEGTEVASMLAFDHDAVIGMATGLRDPMNRTMTYLVGMWVAPVWRGTDVAASLVDSVISWAKELGAEAILLGVRQGNDRAVSFYRKMGFESYQGTMPDHPAIGSCELVFGRRISRE
jgi:GNAT superfamily N-acetyltransferase